MSRATDLETSAGPRRGGIFFGDEEELSGGVTLKKGRGKKSFEERPADKGGSVRPPGIQCVRVGVPEFSTNSNSVSSAYCPWCHIQYANPSQAIKVPKC
jgi:hypothetical protein